MGGIFRMWCLALLVLLFCTHSWGACVQQSSTVGSTTQFACYNNTYCGGDPLLKPTECSRTKVGGGGYVWVNDRTGSWSICYTSWNITSGCPSGYQNSALMRDCYYYLRCDTQAEADSAFCALNPTAEGCGNCKAADSTWYSNAVDSCNAIYGENNYSIVDTNDVCEHRGHCCSKDSTIAGNVCTWKCESVASQCQPPLNFYSGILLGTTASDTGDVVQGRCYYNCINYVPSDTTKAMVSGNILLTGPVSAMSQGTKVPNAFNSVRITDNDTYIYDYLFPQAEHYLDSIAFTPCVQALYRGVLNGKYVYWYDGQAAPAGVSNIVKVK